MFSVFEVSFFPYVFNLSNELYYSSYAMPRQDLPKVCKSRLSREMNCDVYGEARMFAFYAMLSDRVSRNFARNRDFHDICEPR